MEDRGCCSTCPISNPNTALVPLAWHPDDDSCKERFCCPCFCRNFPDETLMAFDLSVLPKWREEGFAPDHVMVLRERKKLLVLISQLDAHHVAQFRLFLAEKAIDGVEEELLRQVARDYRETKDAVAKMATRAWWDQMAFWRLL